ncbi:hypothetical protein P4O66_005336, partial [Electrophorus voltai]
MKELIVNCREKQPGLGTSRTGRPSREWCIQLSIIRNELPDLKTIYYKRCWTKARNITGDPNHPNNGMFFLL